MILVETDVERELMTVTYCGHVRLREGFDATLDPPSLKLWRDC